MPGHIAQRSHHPRARASRAPGARSTLCQRRGLFSIGPVHDHDRRPLRLLPATRRRYGRPQNILVYPRATELPNFYVPPANLPGEGRFRRRTHYVTPNASGVRDYEPGDSFNRIHWPIDRAHRRAHGQALRARPRQRHLDHPRPRQARARRRGRRRHRGVRGARSPLRSRASSSSPTAPSASSATASASSSKRRSAAPSTTRASSKRWRWRRAEGDVPIGTLISEEAKRFGRHTTVVVITPSTNEDWVGSLQFIAERGVKVAAVLLEPSTFGGKENSLMVFGALAASDVYTYLVKQVGRPDHLARAGRRMHGSAAAGGRRHETGILGRDVPRRRRRASRREALRSVARSSASSPGKSWSRWSSS